MKKHTTSTAIPTYALKAEPLASMSVSFERFCPAAGLETLSEMLEQDATAACGERHERGERRQAHRWGGPKASSAFTVARSRSSAPGFAGSMGPSGYCRVGRTRSFPRSDAVWRQPLRQHAAAKIDVPDIPPSSSRSSPSTTRCCSGTRSTPVSPGASGSYPRRPEEGHRDRRSAMFRAGDAGRSLTSGFGSARPPDRRTHRR
jgi:hypothetical protein